MRRWTLLLAGIALAGEGSAACKVQSGHLLPLLELYTSEGCSSCPPADRWLSGLARAPIDAVPLAFHVDYWDDLGWKDRFASPLHARRQRARVQMAGGRIVYTPQVMLGQDVQVKWTDAEALAAAATAAVLQPAHLDATLTARRDGRDLEVALSAGGLPGRDWTVQYAIYADGLSSTVTAGENRSLVLRHDRVVLAMRGPWPVEAGGVPARRLPLPVQASGVAALFTLLGEPGTGWALDLPLGTCADEADAAH